MSPRLIVHLITYQSIKQPINFISPTRAYDDSVHSGLTTVSQFVPSIILSDTKGKGSCTKLGGAKAHFLLDSSTCRATTSGMQLLGDLNVVMMNWQALSPKSDRKAMTNYRWESFWLGNRQILQNIWNKLKSWASNATIWWRLVAEDVLKTFKTRVCLLFINFVIHYSWDSEIAIITFCYGGLILKNSFLILTSSGRNLTEQNLP